MLDLAVGRKMLRKFLLCNDGDRGVGAKQNGAGRCRALVDGKDVSGHAFPLNFFGGWVQTNSHQREAACAGRCCASEIDMCCSRRSQEVMVLINSIETVIGPTPPGTGVM
jgi:hypothetical protein